MGIHGAAVGGFYVSSSPARNLEPSDMGRLVLRNGTRVYPLSRGEGSPSWSPPVLCKCLCNGSPSPECCGSFCLEEWRQRKYFWGWVSGLGQEDSSSPAGVSASCLTAGAVEDPSTFSTCPGCGDTSGWKCGVGMPSSELLKSIGSTCLFPWGSAGNAWRPAWNCLFLLGD